jgi:hypothetical protein
MAGPGIVEYKGYSPMKKYLWIAAVLMASSWSLAIADDGVHGAGARHHAWKKYVRENSWHEQS